MATAIGTRLTRPLITLMVIVALALTLALAAAHTHDTIGKRLPGRAPQMVRLVPGRMSLLALRAVPRTPLVAGIVVKRALVR
jgi:hypothetical protein